MYRNMYYIYVTIVTLQLRLTLELDSICNYCTVYTNFVLVIRCGVLEGWNSQG